MSAYATAMSLVAKPVEDLEHLRQRVLSLLCLSPETSDDMTFKRIAKGADFQQHIEASKRDADADIELSVILMES